MKAAVVSTLGGPSSVEVKQIAAPAWGTGAVVAIRRVGLNHSDVLRTMGKYQDKPELPFSPGGEIAGIIEREPSSAPTPGLKAGQRVMAYVGHGGARERLEIDPSRLVPIPDGVTDDVASGVPVTYGTALHALRERASITPGDTIAVLGAGGGAGLAAVEVAKLLGAIVVAVASSDKHDLCRLHGADACLDRDTPNLKQALRDIAAGSGELGREGPAVIYDCVGGALAEPAFRSLRHGGSYLVIGFASRTVPTLPLNIALVKGVAIIGVNWPEAVARNPSGHLADMSFALDAIAQRRLKPRVHRVYPLNEIREALTLLDQGAAAGKIILSVN